MKIVQQIFEEYGLSIEERKAKLLSEYIDLLIKAPINLTSIKDYEQAIHKHVIDVLLPVDRVEGEILDIGTGGGIPGIVYAIVFAVKITLVESIKKKARWLDQTIADLNLKNAKVICSRVEELGTEMRESFDTVTARAVAELRVLAELCAPFCKVGGRLFFYKGPKWKEEYDQSQSAMKILGLELEKAIEYSLKTGERRALLKFRKLRETQQIFPRKMSVILKKPL
ncbi:MAG TPA: 16S rRNA (guanine(527)-N(7))-methyltransferase RsmG [Pseudothermotoga sp.]|nr:16S rRNA (guanine(527)-N(7))-methyltransferase RsmG [Pseudothermotoga sp.]HOK83368.1 16S rRNA (guanine(527)-N(7))-methyltransferase RsmG [Pseudothermotoga sp.]